MAILWLAIGIVIGLLAAWFSLNMRWSKPLSELRAGRSQTSHRVERALEKEREAHEATKQQLSEVDAREDSTSSQNATVRADLDASREELESVKAAAAQTSAKFAHLQSQCDDLAARLKAAEDGRAQLDAQLRQAEADRDAARDDCRSQISTHEARLRDRDEAVARLETELAALRAKSGGHMGVSPAEPGPAPHAEAEAAATALMDDLTKIKGIGPVLKEKLFGLGITSFRQIADFTQDDIDRVNEVLNFRGRIEREQWVEQARTIVQGGSIP